jgi:hypothetical protein
MLDVRPLAYVAPVAEQEIGPLTPIVAVKNFADEDARIFALFRIYRESLGTLEYDSVSATVELLHGQTTSLAALTPYDPGAPADDDYFILCGITVQSISTGQLEVVELGQYWFDVKPAPMGAPPATHHTTHEAGGMDPVDVSGMPGLLADPQSPENHAASHSNGQADEIDVAGLHGQLADDQPALQHDLADPLEHTSNATTGQILQADANGLPVDATNTDAEVAAVVSGAERSANKGAAGGYCGLPNPLDPTLPLRADGTAGIRLGLLVESDFLWAYNVVDSLPWQPAAINSGTRGMLTGTANHPGTVRISSSTSANSGWYYNLPANVLLLAGGEQGDLVCRPQTLAGTTVRFGYHDASSVTSPTDGCYIYQDPATGIITGRTMTNSVGSTTGTGYQLVTNTWYRWRVVVNSDASRVDFFCFDEAGNQLWTDNLTTNIPTAAGRETGHGIVATNSGTTAVALVDLDYINLEIRRVLIR